MIVHSGRHIAEETVIYKVVIPHSPVPSPTYASAIIKYKRARCLYRLNRWTHPRVEHSPLMGFEDLTSAKCFAFMTKWSVVFAAKARNVWKPSQTHEIPHITPLTHNEDAYVDIIVNYWNGMGITTGAPAYMPGNTVWCDAIKLLKEIPV